MDLKGIRAFVVLAQELHFGRAAARLHIVQPALSYQIRQLEESLDVRLLERTTRAVSLTPAGVLFLNEARQALHHVDLARQVAREVEAGTAGPLRIGFVDSATWSVFTEAVRDFHTQFPRVEIELHQMPRMAQVAALSNGGLDLGVLPGPVKIVGFTTSVLTQEPLELVMPLGHPLAARSSVPIAMLAGERLVAFPSVIDQRRIDEIVLEICATAGFTPVFGQAVQQMHTAMALVSAGFGLTIVPRWMRPAWSHNVEFRPLLPITPYKLVMAYSESRPAPAVLAFCKLAESLARQQQKDDNPSRAIDLSK